MASIVKKINKNNLKNINGGLVKPPSWLPENIVYETIIGSMAYGVSSDSSDMDVYGFCIPKKNFIFPHLSGHIRGFGKKPEGFDQWQEHHIQDPSAGKEYDVTIYSIVKYFQLCMENNPNMIDSLFTPQSCVLHMTPIANMVRENRKIFLHKGCFFKLKGYAYSQLHKAEIKNPKELSKRWKTYQKYGMDTKFCYHVVRLLGQCEQILTDHDLDLQRNNEHLKAIRRGEVSFEEIKRYFNDKENSLEKLYSESKLQNSPDEPRIKQLLIDCLEQHYGSLKDAVVNVDQAVIALREINEVILKNQRLL
jgi:predicted nucleotidyltransferase